jgi:hypothetical protein
MFANLIFLPLIVFAFLLLSSLHPLIAETWLISSLLIFCNISHTFLKSLKMCLFRSYICVSRAWIVISSAAMFIYVYSMYVHSKHSWSLERATLLEIHAEIHEIPMWTTGVTNQEPWVLEKFILLRCWVSNTVLPLPMSKFYGFRHGFFYSVASLQFSLCPKPMSKQMPFYKYVATHTYR